MQMNTHSSGSSCTPPTTASTKNITVPDMFEAYLSQALHMHNQGVKQNSCVCYKIKSEKVVECECLSVRYLHFY